MFCLKSIVHQWEIVLVRIHTTIRPRRINAGPTANHAQFAYMYGKWMPALRDTVPDPRYACVGGLCTHEANAEEVAPAFGVRTGRGSTRTVV